MNKKLKCFTLLETLIVMVVMVVVIASVFSVFLVVISYFNKYQSKKDQSTDFVFFDKIFDKEIFHADSVMLSEDQQISVYIKNRKIDYIVSDSSVIRFETAADTFHIDVFDTKLQFIDPASFVINEVVLKSLVNGDTIVSVYKKRYAADTYLKYAIRD